MLLQRPKPATLLPVTSRFSRLALRDGGKSAGDALAAAETFIAAEQEKYFGWVAADLDELDRRLARLAAERDNAEANEAAYIKASHIRDLGGSFGHDIITQAADSLCELLYRLRAAQTYSQEAISAHRAALKLVCAISFGAMPPESGPALLAGLRQVVDKYPRPTR